MQGKRKRKANASAQNPGVPDHYHPLMDGNKRAAWASVRMFIDLNGGHWDPEPPVVDEAEEAMLAIAGGDVDGAWAAKWLRERVAFDA